MKKRMAALILSICIFFSGCLYSQGNIYLKLGDIKGEASDKDHKEWIVISSFEQGLSNSGALSVAGGGAGKVRFSELKLTRKLDKSTPLLMMKVANGAHIPDAILEMTGSDGKAMYTIKLSDVLVSSITSSAECNPGCTVAEEIKLSFSKVNWEYRDKAGAVSRGGWDVKLNKPM